MKEAVLMESKNGEATREEWKRQHREKRIAHRTEEDRKRRSERVWAVVCVSFPAIIVVGAVVFMVLASGDKAPVDETQKIDDRLLKEFVVSLKSFASKDLVAAHSTVLSKAHLQSWNVKRVDERSVTVSFCINSAQRATSYALRLRRSPTVKDALGFVEDACAGGKFQLTEDWNPESLPAAVYRSVTGKEHPSTFRFYVRKEKGELSSELIHECVLMDTLVFQGVTETHPLSLLPELRKRRTR